MQTVKNVLLILTLAVTITISFQSQSAYADNFNFKEGSILSKIQNVIEDVRLGITFDRENKIRLLDEFIEDKQRRIDDAFDSGQSISMDIEDRRKALVRQFEDTNQTIETTSKKLRQVGEINEIRILYSQFADCLNSCTDLEKQEFNEKVNSLESWKNNCSGKFIITDYKYTFGSFDRLSDKCPELKKYDRGYLKAVISGNV